MEYELLKSEVEKLDRVIKASEQWSSEYEKTPEQHAGLIRMEARLERNLRDYFLGLSERAITYINWNAYYAKLSTVKADEIEVIVEITEGPLGREDALFIQAIFDPITASMALGIEAGEEVYQTGVGLTQSSIEVQRASREMVAQLVGKKIDKDGNIIDNPNAKMRVSNRTRREIQESIRTSLALGENIEDAKLRLTKTIRNTKRAETIARTETVNAYQRGMSIFGMKSGAVGKEWLSVNPNDICGQYASLGVVPIDFVYDSFSKIKHPSAHPNCRCSVRFIYPEELEAKSIDK